METKLGALLRELRRARGESLETVAKSVGISIGHLSYIETGERNPTFSVLKGLADHYGVSTEYLGWYLEDEVPDLTEEEKEAWFNLQSRLRLAFRKGRKGGVSKEVIQGLIQILQSSSSE